MASRSEFLYMSLKRQQAQQTEKDGRASGLDRKQEGKTERQKGCRVHLRLAVITCSVSHHMTRMLNAELGNLTYFHQTDTEIHREAVLRC